MARQRHLSKAPIREALIDIQVMPSRPSMDAIVKLSASLAGEASRTADIWQASVGFEFRDNGVSDAKTNRTVIGRRIDCKDSLHVVQFRVNGFTFSRLPPYEDWGQMRQQALRFWEMYARATSPAAILRVAVRYINEIKLPLPMADFSDFLTASPVVPAALPQTISGFVQRVVMVDGASGNFAGVVQALEEPQQWGAMPSELKVLLDIEAYRQLTVASNDFTPAWVVLDELREFKNRIFFEHLQERIVETFE